MAPASSRNFQCFRRVRDPSMQKLFGCHLLLAACLQQSAVKALSLLALNVKKHGYVQGGALSCSRRCSRISSTSVKQEFSNHVERYSLRVSLKSNSILRVRLPVHMVTLTLEITSSLPWMSLNYILNLILCADDKVGNRKLLQAPGGPGPSAGESPYNACLSYGHSSLCDYMRMRSVAYL